MTRRRFMRAAAGAAICAGGISVFRSRRAHAFGEVPPDYANAMLPPDLQAESVLELFLFGGVSQYESFYAVPSFGNNELGYWAHINTGELQQAASVCGFPELWLGYVGPDSTGADVHLGPFARPIGARRDLLERMRILLTAHDALPHEVAVPLSLTGRLLGNNDVAAMGAHVERAFGAEGRLAAYVILPTHPVVSDLGRAAYATGRHPTATRPLPLFIDHVDDLQTLLARAHIASPSAHDALVQANVDRFGARLRHKGLGQPLRSSRLQAFEAATLSMKNAPTLGQILQSGDALLASGSSCGTSADLDRPTTSLRLAALLLTNPVAPARHVTVIDGGFVETNEAGGYDTHAQDCPIQAANVTQVLKALASVINEPGENDPTKIDLDKTLVVINTEFGRTPYLEGNGGRGHWPSAYPVVLLGGPIRHENHGVYGGLDADGNAKVSIRPQEHRIAVLYALGLWPFQPEAFNVSDVLGAEHEIDGLLDVRKRVLGLS
jgi:hypothetical protein